jgi:hypothetical protein
MVELFKDDEFSRAKEPKNYLIMRVSKIKSRHAVTQSMKHNFREQETPNADESKIGDNKHLTAKSTAEGMQRYKDLLPEKVRKNAVHALHYVVTTSPTASKEDNQIALDEAVAWVTEKHGAENILFASIHRDETTPHLHVVAMPMRDGKLNAKHFVGGSKHRLSELQDEIYDRVKPQTALERGIRGSKATHKTIAEWRAEIDSGAPQLDSKQIGAITAKQGVFDSKTKQKERENEVLRSEYDKLARYTSHIEQKEALQGETLESQADRLANLKVAEKAYLTAPTPNSKKVIEKAFEKAVEYAEKENAEYRESQKAKLKAKNEQAKSSRNIDR